MFCRKKLDEMEQDIRNKSMIASQRFTEIILSIWVLVCLFSKRSFALPAYVLLSQLVVRVISSMIYKRQVGDERWKRVLVIFTAIVGGTIFLVLLAAMFMVSEVEVE
jgi:hypothetical protein